MIDNFIFATPPKPDDSGHCIIKILTETEFKNLNEIMSVMQYDFSANGENMIQAIIKILTESEFKNSNEIMSVMPVLTKI